MKISKNYVHKWIFKNPSKEKGIIFLFTGLTILILSTLLISYIVYTSSQRLHIAGNQYRIEQAEQAAEAGIEYGIAYLQAKRNIVISQASAGQVNYTLATQTLPTNASYQITFSNPVPNNYTSFLISSIGKDNSQTAIAKHVQLVKLSPILYTYSSAGVTATGQINLKNQAQSTPNPISTPMTADNFFATYFYAPRQSILALATNTSPVIGTAYINQNLSNYGTVLNGVTRKLIWIQQSSGTININTTGVPGGQVNIGTTTNPVILIIQGNLLIGSNVNIYGIVYVANNWDNTQGSGQKSPSIQGNVLVEGNVTLGNVTSVQYNQSILNQVKTLGPYAKVPHYWQDFSLSS